MQTQRAPCVQREAGGRSEPRFPIFPGPSPRSSPARGRRLGAESAVGGEDSEKSQRFPGERASEKELLSIAGEKKGKKTNRNFLTESRAQSLRNVKALCKSGGEARSRNGASSPDTLSFSGAQPSTLWLGFSKQPRDAEAQFLPHCKSLKEFSLSRLTKRR